MVDNFLIGDKNNFAVELCIPDEQESHHLFGGIRLWLQGKYIGAFEDMNILSVTLHALEVVTNNRRKIFADGFQVLPKDNIYYHIKSEVNIGGGRYFFSPGEGFDDFSIVVYRHAGMISFIWELDERTNFSYPNYPKEIQYADIEEGYFMEVTSQFRVQIDKLKIELNLPAPPSFRTRKS